MHAKSLCKILIFVLRGDRFPKFAPQTVPILEQYLAKTGKFGLEFPVLLPSLGEDISKAIGRISIIFEDSRSSRCAL